jgi:Outer membrane protein beta-barrel domain
MKQIFFLSILLGFSGAAQSAAAQLSLGFAGVVNLSNLSANVNETSGTLGSTGLGGGIVVQYQLGDKIAVSLQPMYLQKGAGLKSESAPPAQIPIFDLETALDLAYIEIPILVKYYITNDVARPYIVAGPSVGFLSGAELVAKLDSEEQVEDVKDDFESIDVSILFGAGVDVPFNLATFFLDGRYAIGLSNIVKEEGQSLKTKGFQIALGARFPIGNKK